MPLSGPGLKTLFALTGRFLRVLQSVSPPQHGLLCSSLMTVRRTQGLDEFHSGDSNSPRAKGFTGAVRVPRKLSLHEREIDLVG